MARRRERGGGRAIKTPKGKRARAKFKPCLKIERTRHVSAAPLRWVCTSPYTCIIRHVPALFSGERKDKYSISCFHFAALQGSIRPCKNFKGTTFCILPAHIIL